MTRPNHALIERLRARMQEKGLNAREIAEMANVGRSFVYDILSGKSTNPTTAKLVSVAKVLEVSVPYLMEGEGWTIAANGNQPSPVIAVPSLQMVQEGNEMLVQEDPLAAYYFSERWLRERLKTQPNHLGVVVVKGDSMKPTLQPNDVLLVDRLQKTPSPPGIFTLYDGIGLITKRLEYLSRRHPSVVCVTSDNPQYRNYERSLDELQIIGRVVWFGREIG